MNSRKQTVMWLGGFLFLVMILVNFLQIGGRALVAGFNTFTMMVFLSFASIRALRYWQTVQNREEARRVWFLLSLGLAFYVAGNLVWAFYNISGIEVPYPSLGDVLWVFAYLLLAVSLINKNSLLGVLPGKRQIMIIVTSGAIIFILIGILILKPMLDYAPTVRAVETALNFFYPLMDFVILVAAAFLVLVLWKGKLSLPWNLTSAGFLVLALADAFFIYASWNGLYYAEGGSVNLLTRSIDLGYGLASFLVAIGVFSFQQTFNVQPENLAFGLDRFAASQPQMVKTLPFSAELQHTFEKLFFMVDHDQRVYYFSQSYRDLCKLTGGDAVTNMGKPLYQVLGMEEALVRELHSELQTLGKKSIHADLYMGRHRIPCVVQARTARNGSDVFLQYWHEDMPVIIEERSTVETALIEDALRSVKGIQSASIEAREAAAFFVIEVQEMYLFLVQMGGFRIGNVLVEKFNQAAAKEGVNVRIMDGRVVLTGLIGVRSMSSLLGLTIGTVQDLTSIESTRDVVKLLNRKIPQNIIRSAQNMGLAL